MPIRIGFIGRMGDGKTTAAKYLNARYGFAHYSFAAGVKEIAKRFFGMKEKNRKLLQQIGMKFREIDKNVWIRYMFKNIPMPIRNVFNLVIDDVRFLNEAKYLRNNGFILVRLVRVNGRKAAGFEHANDPSEQELEEICPDYVLQTFKLPNDVWRIELQNQLDKLIKSLKGKE